MQFNPKQQKEFAQKMNKELERMTMSWDNDLKEWHPIAQASLEHASAMSLNIPQDKYSTLLEVTTHGINMNVVVVLIECIASRTPREMGFSLQEWADILLLNARVSQRWNELVFPINQKIAKEMQIMAGKPKLVLAQA